jgi:Sporulation and spore germination/Immunoglobulin-like domain of bacterial spore germination
MTLRILALAGACILAAGCGGSGAVDVGPASGQGGETGAVTHVATSSTVVTVPGTAPSRMRLEVWLERSRKLWPVVRSVPLTPAIVGAAVSGLLAGPTPAEAAAGARSAVPAGTQLLGISLHGGVATVDLTSEFEVGGPARERMSLAQLVYSVTQFPTVHALRLHLDGQPVTAFADGLVLPDPITGTSMGFPRLVAPIAVTNIPPGTAVRAPFTVRGIADVFEAALSYRLLDAAGHEVAAGASAAACGTGCAGPFDFTIHDLGVSSDQRGTLVIRGGGQVLRLPLRLFAPFDVTRPVAGAPLNSPAVISFRHPIAAPVVVRVFDSHHRVLGRRVVTDACVARCQPALYTVRIPFSVAGLQQGYVEISPLHPRPNAPGQIVRIPVALNGG